MGCSFPRSGVGTHFRTLQRRFMWRAWRLFVLVPALRRGNAFPDAPASVHVESMALVCARSRAPAWERVSGRSSVGSCGEHGACLCSFPRSGVGTRFRTLQRRLMWRAWRLFVLVPALRRGNAFPDAPASVNVESMALVCARSRAPAWERVSGRSSVG